MGGLRRMEMEDGSYRDDRDVPACADRISKGSWRSRVVLEFIYYNKRVVINRTR